MAVDPNIKKKADDIRNKIYGKEVRESLASGLEAMSSDVVENEGRQSVVEGRQDSVESQWQVVSDEMTDKDVISAPEIITARNGEANLKARLDKENQEVTSQLAQAKSKVDNVVTIDITDFGAVGDGETDNTEAFQSAIDSLPTLTTYTYNMTTIKANVNGGKIKIPRGKFVVKGTIKYKGGIILEGDGYNTVIDNKPTLPVDLFSPDLTKPTVIGTIQNFQLKNMSLRGSFDPTSGTGLSNIAIDLHNAGNSRLDNLYIRGFETGVNDSNDKIGAYYNTLSNSSVRACRTNIKAHSAGFAINNCSISATPANTVIDHLIDVRGEGVSISNSHIEGQVNEALFNIAGKGFSMVGGYSENTRSSRFADIDISKTTLGSINIQGMNTPNYVIRFYGLYKGGLEADHFVPGYSFSGGININSKGTYMPDVIKNGNFKNGLFQWRKARNEIKAEVTSENMFSSKQAIRLTKDSEYTSSAGIEHSFKLETPNVFITCMVKTSEKAKARMYLSNTPSKLYNLTKIAEYEGTGWDMYGVWVPPLEHGKTYSLQLLVDKDTPVGEWVEFSNVEAYSNGVDYFPFERQEIYHYDRRPEIGKWSIGDKVYLDNVSPNSPLGYVCTTSGEFGTSTAPIFKGFGMIEE